MAQAAFPKGSLAIRIRDELGVLFEDSDFATGFSARGWPAMPPGTLALVSVLQFAEGLSDRQAADAVRARIDWKYALGLELSDPGFDYSVLSEFRSRLVACGVEQRLLDAVLERAAAVGLLRSGGRQRSDSTHVLAAIRSMSRLELVHETVRAALNALAAAAPEWLSEQAEPAWFDRYQARAEDYRLPKGKDGRIQLGHEVGADGRGILQAVHASSAPVWLREIPAVQFLRKAWIQQYLVIGDDLRWRTPEQLPPSAIRLLCPYETDARTGTKRETHWDGYKIRLTETCDDDAPRIITNVATTIASGNDFDSTDEIHRELAGRGLAPAVHLLDRGYMSAHALTAASEQGIELVGPMMPDNAWQSAEGQGFAVSDFTVDWNNKRVTCPNGAASRSWKPETQASSQVIRVRFSPRDCRPCPSRDRCTRAATGRRMTLRPREEHEALMKARAA